MLSWLLFCLHGNIASASLQLISSNGRNIPFISKGSRTVITGRHRRNVFPCNAKPLTPEEVSTKTKKFFPYHNESDEVYDISDCSIRSFNMDLFNLAMEDPVAAVDAVSYLQEQQGKLLPNTASFGIVMDGFIQNNDLESAEAFLFRNETRSSTFHECLQLMHAWKDYEIDNDFRGYGAERAEGIMRRYHGPDEEKLLCVAIEAWCRRAGICNFALDRSEKLLAKMEGRPSGNTTETSQLYAYTSYMVGLSKTSRPNLATTAQHIYDTKIPQPDIVAVTAVLNCWAKTRSYSERSIAAARAIAILDDLETCKYLEANVVTYRTAIAAIGNSPLDSDLALAESIIQERMPRKGIEPDTKTYNAWLLYGIRDAKRAVEILETMPCDPDVETWGAVLRLCDPEIGQALLDKMELLHMKDRSNVRPNSVCFTTVMNAWKRSKSPNALDKIESILKKMEESFAKSLMLDVRPTVMSYATYIDALLRYAGADAAERAEATVGRMLSLYGTGLGYVRPTRVIFNAVINAWARSEAADAPSNAENIFHFMEKRYKETKDLSLRPDESSLCGVLNAWAAHAKDRGAERAMAILVHAQNVPDAERGFPITLRMHNTIARSGDPLAVQKAENILIDLENDSISGRSPLKPDIVTYSSVINACAYCTRTVKDSQGRTEALKVAMRTYNKLVDDPNERPNHIVYGTLFKAISCLLPASRSRDTLVRKLFKRCCDAGCVDGFVLTQLRSSCKDLFTEIKLKYGKSEVREVLEQLPSTWTANVD